MAPQFVQRSDKGVNFTRPVNRGGRETQPLCAARDCWEIDRLHIDAVLLQQQVGQLLTMDGITNKPALALSIARTWTSIISG